MATTLRLFLAVIFAPVSFLLFKIPLSVPSVSFYRRLIVTDTTGTTGGVFFVFYIFWIGGSVALCFVSWPANGSAFISSSRSLALPSGPPPLSSKKASASSAAVFSSSKDSVSVSSS